MAPTHEATCNRFRLYEQQPSFPAAFTIATISAFTFSGSLAHAAPRSGTAGEEPFAFPFPFATPFLDFLISGGAGSNSIAAD